MVLVIEKPNAYFFSIRYGCGLIEIVQDCGAVDKQTSQPSIAHQLRLGLH